MCERQRLERIQLSKIMLDAALAKMLDSETTKDVLTTWLSIQAEAGDDVIELAMDCQPLSMVIVDEVEKQYLLLIDGSAYSCSFVGGMIVQWRVRRLANIANEDPYCVCRLTDGTLQCDCGDWVFRVNEAKGATVTHCKHLRALASLGLI